MTFSEGDRVRNPSQPKWGIGQVIDDSAGDRISVFFLNAGRKKFHVENSLVKVENKPHDTLDILSGLDWNKSRRNVYVIELRSEVFNKGRFSEENPHCSKSCVCLYVGSTGHPPEKRFEQHRKGYKASKYTKGYVKRLLPRLYEHFNPMPDELAYKLEEYLGNFLRGNGYAVWWN